MGRCCVYQTKLYIVYYFIPVYFTRLQRVWRIQYWVFRIRPNWFHKTWNFR
jgi:hypothetical protein